MEYIVTVNDPAVWDQIWDTITKDGLSDNYIPSRAIPVLNERPFNDFAAHFDLTEQEAEILKQDPRIAGVELQADLRPHVEKKFNGTRTAKYDKTNTIDTTMKNWALLRCINTANPFAQSSSVVGNYTYNLDGTGVDIVIIDSGVEPNHPEFAVNADGTGGSRVVDFDWTTLGVQGTPSGASIGGYLGDSDGHGSNCASIIAGNTCGWAPGAKIYSIRIFAGTDIRTGASLLGFNSDIVYDLVRAFHLKKIADGNPRPTICSNSWGYYSSYSGMQYTVWRGTQYNISTSSSTYGQVYFYHPYNLDYLNQSVNNAAAAGVIMVGAAGNYRHKIDVSGGQDYNNYWRYSDSTYSENVYYHRGSSPTSASSMINVGALDNSTTEQKAYFSETGPRVDIWSPGVMIMGAYANKSYVTPAVPDPRASGYYLNKISGTSQATPNVAGMIACIAQARPTMTPAQAKAFITDNATQNALVITGTPGYTNQTDLQGSANKLLRNPFNNASRGSITS